MIAYYVAALGSGIAMEALYALGVIYISRRQAYAAGGLSAAWGACTALGGYEIYKTPAALIFWCLGLAIGTILVVRLVPEEKKDV